MKTAIFLALTVSLVPSLCKAQVFTNPMTAQIFAQAP